MLPLCQSRALFLLFFFASLPAAFGQIDPTKRELFQFGYNGALQGHSPLAVYAFYYRNQTNFLEHTNLTLRLAVAPTYLDSELGFKGLLSPNTDVGIGLAGGGFADRYSEIRSGKYLPPESFSGHGAEMSLSVYHLFNPDQQIPLYGIVRGAAHYTFYERDQDTAENFQLPADHGTFSVRTGLRWGGIEPILFPSLAMELSIWYEGYFRSETGLYGFNDDRRLEGDSHRLWAQALLAYTLPEWEHTFYISFSAGTSSRADRFSAYRMGALLPMVSEFPLSVPGYYYEEISATDYFLAGGNYSIPLDTAHRWNINATAATAVVRYLEGLEQPGHTHSGGGGGVIYKSRTWRTMVGYAYGIDAIRSGGRGAHSVGFLLQFDFASARDAFYNADPGRWRGFQRIFGVLGD